MNPHFKSFIRTWQLLFATALFCALPSCAKSSSQPIVNQPTAQPASASSNLVKNPGFEDGVAHWKLPQNGATATSDAAHSGKSSLHYDNTDPKTYNLMVQFLDVEPGQYIRFSGWVKGKNIQNEKKSQGAGIYMQSTDANGKYISGAFPSTPQGTFDWTPLNSEYLVPPNATEVAIGCYLRKGTTGEAWFDDMQASIVPPTPFVSLLTFPNYRGMVKVGDSHPWTSFIRINALPEWRSGDVTIHTVLSNASGKVLLDKSSKMPSTKSTFRLSFQPPANLPVGDYTLTQTFTDPNGKESLQQKNSIQVVSEMPKVYVDADGFTVVKGQRFFPLGVYYGDTSGDDFQRLEDGGFNTILGYKYGSGGGGEDYMKDAAKHHLQVIYSLKDMIPGYNDTTSVEKAAGYVKKFSGYDNLLAWYINDERPPKFLPGLKELYNETVKLDKQHPAFQLITALDVAEKYFSSTDIMGTDPYPVGDNDLSMTSRKSRAIAAAAHGAKSVWIVPQIFDLSITHPERKQHRPSRDEIRNQSYQAIINGATGLIYFSYYNLIYEKYPRGEATKNLALFQQRWTDLSSVSKEIKALVPAILHGSKVPLEMSTKSDVQASAIDYQNHLLILLANPDYAPKQITMNLPKGWKIKQAEQGNIKSTFQGSKVTFTLPSLGSGVFKLEK